MAEHAAPADSSRVQAVPEPVRGRFTVFAVVSLALMMASVDQTIVATALPAIQRDLHTGVNWSSWTITVYALGQVLVMPLAGRAGDQFGRKQIFLGAVVLFTAASPPSTAAAGRAGGAAAGARAPRWLGQRGRCDIAVHLTRSM